MNNHLEKEMEETSLCCDAVIRLGRCFDCKEGVE